MADDIDGREVWIVSIGREPEWRVVGVFSSEERAEAAIAHVQDGNPSVFATAVKFLVDEELSSWWPDRDIAEIPAQR